MSIFLSWPQFMIACLKLCPTWWTFKRRLRNRGHFFLTRIIKLTCSRDLACVQPSPPLEKKKDGKSWQVVWARQKEIEINIIYFYLFVYLLQFNGLLNAQPFLTPPVDPPALAFFSPWMANFRGWGPLSCQISRGGDEKRGQMPRPPSTLQHFSLIAQSSSAMGLCSPYGHLYNMDTSLLRTVRLVPEKPKIIHSQYLYNTDTSKRTLGSIPLVGILKRFDCF